LNQHAVALLFFGTFLVTFQQAFDLFLQGKLTMELVHFMTNTCGWGLKLIDGCTLGSALGRRNIHQQQPLKTKHSVL